MSTLLSSVSAVPPSFHSTGSDSIPGQSCLRLQWAKQHCDMLCFPLSVIIPLVLHIHQSTGPIGGHSTRRLLSSCLYNLKTCSSGNTSDLHSGGAQFESQPGHNCLYFMVLHSSFRHMLGHNCFLPHPFQIVIH
jgi:hypothetical protein